MAHQEQLVRLQMHLSITLGQCRLRTLMTLAMSCTILNGFTRILISHQTSGGGGFVEVGGNKTMGVQEKVSL